MGEKNSTARPPSRKSKTAQPTDRPAVRPPGRRTTLPSDRSDVTPTNRPTIRPPIRQSDPTTKWCFDFSWVCLISRTTVQNSLILRHLIIHFPTSLGVSERASEQMSTAERASEESSVEQANEWVVRTDKRVLTSWFVAVLNHSATFPQRGRHFTEAVSEKAALNKEKNANGAFSNHVIHSRRGSSNYSCYDVWVCIWVSFCLSVSVSVSLSFYVSVSLWLFLYLFEQESLFLHVFLRHLFIFFSSSPPPFTTSFSSPSSFSSSPSSSSSSSSSFSSSPSFTTSTDRCRLRLNDCFTVPMHLPPYQICKNLPLHSEPHQTTPRCCRDLSKEFFKCNMVQILMTTFLLCLLLIVSRKLRGKLDIEWTIKKFHLASSGLSRLPRIEIFFN